MAAVARREYVWLGLVGAVLITAMFVVRAEADTIHSFIGEHPFWGAFLYLVLNILDAVFAPGATLPLIPVAARVWGRGLAALATTVGWSAGSLIAFLIARRWGAPIVRRIASMQRVRNLRRHIPQDLFWSIVLIRLLMPMDVVSYAVGLFTHMGWARYVAATALGLAPSALLLTYLGRLPHAYEIIAFGVGGATVAAWILVARRRSTS